jgi:pimeloyl-ACP methyl ester carboxylesterase
VHVLEAKLDAGEGSDDDALEGMMLAWPGYFSDRANVPAMPEMRTDSSGFKTTVDDTLVRLADGALGAQLALSTCPVLFIAGEDDPAPLEVVEQAVHAMASSTLKIIPGCGHFPWWEVPGATREIVAAWLEHKQVA